MTDREMLELAAKAAGLDGVITEYPSGHVEMGMRSHFKPNGSNIWMPLYDDGDALRLAVKLQLTVCNEHLSAGCVYCTSGADWSGPKVDARWPQQQAVVEGDYAATRRAIVRAAAEIGRAMP